MVVELCGRRILQTNKPENQTPSVIASKIRWFAVVTGCFAAIAGYFRFGYANACVPGFIIMGAIIQGRFPRFGRVLICAGAIALSYWVFVVDVFLLIETNPTRHLGQFSLTLASVLLVALCDYAIAIEEIKIRRAHNRKKPDVVPFSKNIRWFAGATGIITGSIFLMDYGLGFLSFFLIVGALIAGRFPQSGKELTWFGAGVVSLSILPLSAWYLFHALDGTDPWVIAGSAASVLLIVLCDVALLMEAIRRKPPRVR